MSINLSNVCFSYPDQPDKLVLNIPHWAVAEGEQLFVHGPSGGGKSTLLNVLCGLIPVGSGAVEVFGHRLDQLSGRQRDKIRAGNIGYVFQQFNLIPYLDAVENILLAKEFAPGVSRATKRGAETQAAVESLLEALQVSRTDWRRPTNKLSIGQQQRIAIARALINQPKLLIADEPTSALDQANRDAFLSLIMPMVNEHKITLLFVSHDQTLSHYFKRCEALSDINTPVSSN